MSPTSRSRSGMESWRKPLVTVTTSTRAGAGAEGGLGVGEARARAKASPTMEVVGMTGTIAMVPDHSQRVIDCPVVMTLLRVPPPLPKAVDLKRTYDAVIVGSGAAGGMAAHVLTSHGLEVLLLEAGKQLDTTAELHSMEWPYDHPRRGEMPYDRHALRGAEYAFR